jgi:hypothetical protein
VSLSDFLDRLVTIKRAGQTRDAGGGVVRAFVTLANPDTDQPLQHMPFAKAPARLSVVESYARRNVVVDHLLWTNQPLETLIPADGNHKAGLNLNDQLVDEGSGEIFVVRGPALKYQNAAVSPDTLYEVHCQLITV